ncbi:MAG TPA: CDP-alcohol phosphatidyltransferase family protein [Gemmatimonadales bacterium]|nr:CDP-alcohol phosphatidyltransferase family protein [Gemmatimonadales bacterium]
MNLPNAITAARIAVTPLIAVLPFIASWEWRLFAFVLYVVAAATDYVDGKLARERGQVTDLGRLLDPLADKLLLLGTFVPMYLLQGGGGPLSFLSPIDVPAVAGLAEGIWLREAGNPAFPFILGSATITLPFLVVLVVLGREALMTAFRQYAARRGVVISAIGPAKWKTGFQSVWVGAAYFWFFAATLAADQAWTSTAWRAFASFNGLVGVVTMVVAVTLTLWSLWLYGRSFAGPVFRARGRSHS